MLSMEFSLSPVIEDLRAYRNRLAHELARVDAALAALTGDLAGRPTNSTSMSMAERVKELFEDEDNVRRNFTAESALKALEEQGWTSDAVDPLNAMRTTLSRMSRRGEICRVDRGEYAAVRRQELQDPWALPASQSDPWEVPPDHGVNPTRMTGADLDDLL